MIKKLLNIWSDKKNDELEEKDKMHKLEMEQQEEKLKQEELKKRLSYEILDLLWSEWVFIVEDIQKWTIIKSNEIWKYIVKKATWKQIIDGRTSIHEFHSTPERSKRILSSMNPWEKRNNTIIKFGKNYFESTSNYIKIWDNDFYIWIFKDITQQIQEVEQINVLRDSLEPLYNFIDFYSQLWTSLKMTSLKIKFSKENVWKQKNISHDVLINALKRLDEDLNIFSSVVWTNTNIWDIADKINLISLNGSIEAARLWEDGRWFVVIAEETRNTANKASDLVKWWIKQLNQAIENSEKETEILKKDIWDILDEKKTEESLNEIISSSDSLLAELRNNVMWLHFKLESLIKNLKVFYEEKLTWEEKLKAKVLMTKFDHLLFIIKLNSYILTWEGFNVSDYETCELGKTIYSESTYSFLDNWKENATYKKLEKEHKIFHDFAKNIKYDIDNFIKNQDFNELKSINEQTNYSLRHQKDKVIQLIEELANEIGSTWY